MVLIAAGYLTLRREPATPRSAPERSGATSVSTTVAVTTTTVVAADFPSGNQPVQAGRYVASRFSAPFTFTLPDGWRRSGPDSPEYLDLVRNGRDGSSLLTLMRVVKVFDRQRAPVSPAQAQEALVANPDDLAGWVRGHPRLVAGASAPVTDGELVGTSVEARPRTPYRYPDCQNDLPCVLLFLSADGLPIFVSEGSVARFHFLRVGSETLVAIIEAPAGQFDGFAAEADRILATLGR